MSADAEELSIEAVDPGRIRRRGRMKIAAGALALLLAGAAGGLYVGRYQFPAADTAAGTPNQVDIGFSEDMTVHHQQAITMAGLAADRSGPAVRPLARQIEHGQLQQVGQLQGWLAVWGAPLLSAQPMAWMSDGGQPMQMPMPGKPANADSDNAMPGLATQDELAQLQSSTGKDLDVLFLQLMMRHHQGGLAMARYAAQHAQLIQVRSLAANMVVDESQEIGYMNVVLAQLGAKPLPAP